MAKPVKRTDENTVAAHEYITSHAQGFVKHADAMKNAISELTSERDELAAQLKDERSLHEKDVTEMKHAHDLAMADLKSKLDKAQDTLRRTVSAINS